jgi:hypothetical protein
MFGLTEMQLRFISLLCLTGTYLFDGCLWEFCTLLCCYEVHVQPYSNFYVGQQEEQQSLCHGYRHLRYSQVCMCRHPVELRTQCGYFQARIGQECNQSTKQPLITGHHVTACNAQHSAASAAHALHMSVPATLEAVPPSDPLPLPAHVAARITANIEQHTACRSAVIAQQRKDFCWWEA